MAAQEQFTVSNPNLVLVQSPQQVRLVEKEREKQKELLAHLKVILQAVEESLVDAKAGVKSPAEGKEASEAASQANPGGGITESDVEKAMVEMTAALEQFQVFMAKMDAKKTGYQGKISGSQAQAAQKNLKDLEKKLAELKKEEKKRKHESFWEKVGEGIAGALTAIVGAILAQPEIVAMGLMTCASAAGLFDYATKGVADVLEACGMGHEAAQLTAAAIVCIAVIIAASSVGDGEEDVTAVADAGVAANSAVGDAVDAGEAANALSEADQQASSFQRAIQAVKESPVGQGGAKILSVLSKINKTIGLRGRMVILATLSSLQNTQITTKIADAIMSAEGYSKERRQEVENKISIGIEVVATVVSFVVMMGASPSESSLFAKVSNLGPKAVTAATYATRGLFYAETTANTVVAFQKAGIDRTLGKYEEQVGDLKANRNLLDAMMDMLSNQMESDKASMVNRQSMQKTDNETIRHLADAERGEAQALTSSPI